LGYDSIFKPQEDNKGFPHMELLTIFSFSLEPSKRGKPWDLIKAFSLYKEETKKRYQACNYRSNRLEVK
jgi:hypothetical protein